MSLNYTVNSQVVGNLWWEIQTYTSNYETTFQADIPTFVQTAEQRIYNSVQIPAIRKNQTGYMTAGNQYLSLPSDWLATFSLAVINPTTLAYSYLIDKDVDFIREAYPITSTLTTPSYYAQFDYQTFIVGPTPDQAYQVEIHYYGYPTSIVIAGTSWLGTNFPEALLYGVLREAYVYMKGEPDVLEMYEKKYSEAMDQLKQLGDGKNRMDAYRNVQVRVPVK
jgi:hypothetical protein